MKKLAKHARQLSRRVCVCDLHIEAEIAACDRNIQHENGHSKCGNRDVCVGLFWTNQIHSFVLKNLIITSGWDHLISEIIASFPNMYQHGKLWSKLWF